MPSRTKCEPKKTCWAIIPARGGSKGVFRKNLRELGGFPLIAYSIVVAKACSEIERVIISTDDEEIAAVGKDFGAEVPFLRPEEIAGDMATDFEFLRHASDFFDLEEGPDMFAILRPTTPLRDPYLIDSAIEFFRSDSRATSLCSVHEFPESPAKMFVKSSGYLSGLLPLDARQDYFSLPRQMFKPAYISNGYIDICSVEQLHKGSMFGDNIFGFDTPDLGEIDVPADFLKLEYFLQRSDLDEVRAVCKLLL